jgi:dynactin complex subunit
MVSTSTDAFVPVARVGARVLVKDKDFGTVKYVGPLHVDKDKTVGQTWYGIDWDDASRGKHDGTLDGVRYFHASAPTSGSFLKPHKSIDFGVDVRAALGEQYTSEDALVPDSKVSYGYAQML